MQTIRGFRDILPEQIRIWQKIEKEATGLFKAFGFEEIRIPVIEKTELFARSIGETTDIVEKEMYTFADRKGDKLTLRPEATASIVRSYIQHKMYAVDPVRKFYCIGPMFRRERPQKGRYRQFYQIDVEVFGVASAYIDSQLIFLLNELFRRLGLTGLSAHINSLGCSECRPGFQTTLLTLLESKKDQLCGNCLRRMNKNPLRILDCKSPGCKAAISDAPATIDHLCLECSDHFKIVQSTLEKQGVDFKVDNTLVRGLDYYTRTAWEILTTSLGAQSAVAGGGRYDGLVRELGGPETPGIGFAIGFDRLAEVMEQLEKAPDPDTVDLFIIALGEAAMEKSYLWYSELNQAGIRTEMDFRGKSMKALMKRADKLNAAQVLIVGENELERNAVVLRDMGTKTQVSLAVDTLVENLTRKMTQSNETG
ncbi:MAG: histidine--tRNA ligase [Desulfobacterales bacterium]|nr:histidine--tRNA ligase [Desulfobacterales bacterium]